MSFRGAVAVAPLLGEDRLGSNAKPLLEPGKCRVLPVEILPFARMALLQRSVLGLLLFGQRASEAVEQTLRGAKIRLP